MKLVYNDQSGREQSVELNEFKNVIRIGRNPDCDISVNDGSVSRVHAMVTWRDGKLYVQDPPNGRPTNGTKVDGMRLKEGEILELLVGSELLCGKFSIRISGEGADDGVARMGDQQGMPQQMTQQGPGPQGMYAPQQPGPQGMYAPQQPGFTARGAYGQPGMTQRGYAPSRPGMPAGGPQSSISPALQINPNATQGPVTGSGPAMTGSGPSMTGSGPVMNAPSEPGRHNTRNNYIPQHIQNMGPASTPQSMMGGASAEELARLSAENEKLRQELEDLKSNASQNDEVQKLQEKLNERDQILTDYERRIENNDTVVTSLTDKIDKLKEQLEHQKDQSQESRRELEIARDEAESLKMELANLRETVESNGAEASSAQNANATLKVELQKKQRMLDDLQRELDLAQYSFKEERDNVERLKESIDMLNANVETAERQNRDMKQLIEQHDVMFAELNGRISDREREVRQLQDALRGKGGADSAALMQELSQVRDNLAKKNSEVELLQKQLRRAEENASAGGDVSELQNRIAELEAELSSKDNSSNAGPSADLTELQDHYQSLNDAVSMCRDDIGTLDTSISDLQRIFVAYVKIDINHLQGQERTRLENALKAHDPKMLFEDIGNALYSSQNNMKAIKEALKAMRGALQM